ncbi:TPA: helix-turn-helix domain-containing protein [Escherichia coli]|nr:helix-turn-helix domain-containing protein [Escherichia coli]HBA7821210.1 helix-turn-helix domain-containing protein [Escherichia coli]HBA8686542.1 helix-turn-helix domain-containing protein [Escherichia coli]HBA8700398.1 helix-turn-helix domain-containing protein [Escherichia coli]HBA9049781.1 helix-turn-helix domain-containing protein [Escherichia coli]
MGYKAMWAASAVIESRDDLDTKEAFTLTAIAKYADDNGKCFPGRKTLMTYTKLGKTATTAAIAGLVAKGLITSEERNDDKGQKSNIYTLLFPLNESDPLPPDGSTPYRDAIAPLPPDGMPPTATRSRNQLSNQLSNQSDLNTPTHDCAGDVVMDKAALREQRQREKVAKAKHASEVIKLFNAIAANTDTLPDAIYGNGKGMDYPAKIAKLGREMTNGGTLEDWERYITQALTNISDFRLNNATFDDLLRLETLRKVRAGRW